MQKEATLQKGFALIYLLPFFAAAIAVAWLENWKTSYPDKKQCRRVGCTALVVIVAVAIIGELISHDTSSAFAIWMGLPVAVAWIFFGRLILEQFDDVKK